MTSNVTINPVLTSNAQGSFNIDSNGYIQGTMLDDPAIRNALAGGYLLASETLPMWGGVGISEIVPGAANTPRTSLGTGVSRATTLAVATSGQQAAGKLTGFSVFNQDHSMINSPQSPVPLAAAYMGINFFRLGSFARIAVAMDPVLVDLQGYLISSLVSWDFSLQRLIPYVAAYPANAFTGITRALVGGVYVATGTTTSAHGVTVGSDFTVSGVVPAAYNGTWTAIAGTAGSTLVWSLGTAVDPGAETTVGTLVAGGGALPVTVLNVDIGNSMVVSYDPTTGFATWSRSGSCAVIQI